MSKLLPLLPTGKPHVSFSELSEWISCSWKHKLKQIDKFVEDRPSPAPLFGSIIHSTLEHFLKTKEMQIDVAIQKIHQTWENCRNKTQVELKLNDNDYKQYVIDFSELQEQKFQKEATLILADVPQFLDNNFPNWEFIDAEHPLNEELENLPFKFKGYIDCIIKCDPISKSKNKHKNKVIWLIDWKTTTYGWASEKKQDQLIRNQLVFYKHFYSKKMNIPLKELRCAFILLKRSAKIGNHCEQLTVSVGEVTIDRAIKHVRNMLSTLQKSIAFKNRDHCIWCEFLGTKHCDSIFKTIK